ncbi:MAG: hypothetical protein QME74_03065 [Candidatus Edwardsbacteria bacterium]|nr:hypothetical protein [Candidatus Edwardsbacteria bacterium]
MRRACIDCIHQKGSSANPYFISCEKCGFVEHPMFGRGEKGIANKKPEEHVCSKYEPDYGPDYVCDILLPLRNRGDTLGKVIAEYYGDVPNPYFVRNQGRLIKLFDNRDGIPTHHILCALSDWISLCDTPFEVKPIVWLTLHDIRQAAMLDEGTFLYIRTPHSIPTPVLNYELALFLLKTVQVPEGRCREHLEQILSGDAKYI